MTSWAACVLPCTTVLLAVDETRTNRAHQKKNGVHCKSRRTPGSTSTNTSTGFYRPFAQYHPTQAAHSRNVSQRLYFSTWTTPDVEETWRQHKYQVPHMKKKNTRATTITYLAVVVGRCIKYADKRRKDSRLTLLYGWFPPCHTTIRPTTDSVGNNTRSTKACPAT